jgi:hypothetical protein
LIAGGYRTTASLREAFPNSTEDQYFIFDRDAKFGAEVLDFLDSCGISPVRTSYRSPWQNGVAERWVRTFRNDPLDHVIVINESHLRRLAQDYLRYYHQDRTHDGLNKDTPAKRPRRFAGTVASGLNRRLASAVFTIDILGQKLHEGCMKFWRPTAAVGHEWRKLDTEC